MTLEDFSPQEFTFARGSNLAATRIGKTGLIEKGRENVLFSQISLILLGNIYAHYFTSGQSGYDGTNDAWIDRMQVILAGIDQKFLLQWCSNI